MFLCGLYVKSKHPSPCLILYYETSMNANKIVLFFICTQFSIHRSTAQRVVPPSIQHFCANKSRYIILIPKELNNIVSEILKNTVNNQLVYNCNAIKYKEA